MATSGFAEIAWVDVSPSALASFQAWNERLPIAEPPSLGLHLLLGPEVREMRRNMLRNLEEGRVVVIQAVFDRPQIEQSGASGSPTGREPEQYPSVGESRVTP